MPSLFAVLFFVATQPALADDKPAALSEYETVKNVAYREDKDADAERHRLDLFIPKGKKDFPVLMFVHGGGWKNGHKDQFEFLGKALTGHGIGVVNINYRLAPKVKFPGNVEDVARAFAWTHSHIGKYGGRADRLFVGGHSAGGHLVSVLATNPAYLQAEKLSIGDIRGVISISGLYDIPRGRFPIFEDSDEGAKKSSPTRLASRDHPPFLLVYADKDFPRFGDMAEDFAKVLRAAKCPVQVMQVKDRTHGSVASKIGEPADPVRAAILEFIAHHSTDKK